MELLWKCMNFIDNSKNYKRLIFENQKKTFIKGCYHNCRKKKTIKIKGCYTQIIFSNRNIRRIQIKLNSKPFL